MFTNTNDQVPYMLKEIPSEMVEPAIQHYFVTVMHDIGCERITVAEGKERLQIIDGFVSNYCGIHAKLATTNLYYKMIIGDDEEILRKTKEIANKYDPI